MAARYRKELRNPQLIFGDTSIHNILDRVLRIMASTFTLIAIICIIVNGIYT